MDATHKCADCTASFWDAEDLSRHRKDAHEDRGAQSWASAEGVGVAGTPDCPICGMEFSTDAAFIQHVFKEHRAGVKESNVTEEEDDITQSGWAWRGSQMRNEYAAQAAHKEPAPPVGHLCGECGTGFHSKDALDWHIFVTHVGGLAPCNLSLAPSSETALPDHHAATVAALRKLADQIEQGASPEDVGPDVVLLGRIMARRT